MIRRTIQDGKDTITHIEEDRKNWKQEAEAKRLLPKPARPWEVIPEPEEPEKEKPIKEPKQKIKKPRAEGAPTRGKKPSGKVLDVSGKTFEEKKSFIVKSLETFLKKKLPSYVEFKKVALRKPEDSCPDGYRVLVQIKKEQIYEANGKFSMARVEKVL
jgi:hypothetical protein